MMGARRLLVVATAIVSVAALAACGSSAKKPASPAQGSAPRSTLLGLGVSAAQIKIGIALPDFSCVKQFTDVIRTHQQETYQAYINDLNAHGGIGGRQLVAVYDMFCPIPNPQVLGQVCTRFAEDEKVFAVLGYIFDPSGASQTCLASRHHTIVLVFDLTRAIMQKSPPGLVIFAGTEPERVDDVLSELLRQNRTLDGKKLAVLGESGTRASITKTLVRDLRHLNVQMGTTTILAIAGSDTTAAQSQLDSAIERWKTEHVDALFVSGEEVASKQFVEKIRREMPGVMLITDISDTLGFAKEEQHAGLRPNPYEGILTAGGLTPHEYDQSDNWKYCAAIYKAQTGQDAPNAETVIPYPGDPSKTLDTNGLINDACQLVTLFHDIASRVGPYLNVENWTATVDSYGPIRNLGGGQYASLHTGKYDIDDSFRLEAFDSSIAPSGNWRPITPLQDVPGP